MVPLCLMSHFSGCSNTYSYFTRYRMLRQVIEMYNFTLQQYNGTTLTLKYEIECFIGVF